MDDWDLIIIGAGPAGLASGVYGVRSGLKTLIIEDKMAGGTVVDAPVIQNYLGFKSVSGAELSQKMADHARGAGVTINEFEKVISLDIGAEAKVVKTQKSAYQAKALIIASGSDYKELGVAGEKEFRGRGVSYCGLCDGPLFRGKRVLVVGGGNSALITALYLTGLVSEVKVVHRRDAFRAEEALVRDLKSKKNAEIMLNTGVIEIRGEKTVEAILVRDAKTGQRRELAVDGVFIQVGELPNSEIAKEAGVAVDETGNIIVDTLQRTNVAGVYAAGDVTNHSVKQVGTAVGQGITAAVEAYSYIRRPYYKQ